MKSCLYKKYGTLSMIVLLPVMVGQDLKIGQKICSFIFRFWISGIVPAM